AFRNDFCLACSAPRMAVQVSTLRVFHLYWVPLLPLGRRSRWLCAECGAQPHHNVKTRRVFKVGGLAVLVFLTGFFWMTPGIPGEPVITWVIRVTALIGALGTAVWIARSSPEVDYRQRMLTVVPSEERLCPFCNVALIRTSLDCYCPECQIKRL